MIRVMKSVERCPAARRAPALFTLAAMVAMVATVVIAAMVGAGGAVAAEIKQGSVRLADDTRLNYLEAGSGPPVVLVPGWSQTAAMFKAQLEGLSDRYRVIAVDMRGHGDSGKPAHGYRIARLARDLHQFLVALDLERVALGGHSMGVSILWSYWEQFQGARVDKLIFIDQAPVCTAMPGWTDARIAESGALFDPQGLWDTAAALAGPDGIATTEGFVRDVFFTKAYPAENLDWVLAENLKFPRGHAARLLIDHCSQDWRDVIRRIRAPTIVFGGEASFFNSVSQRWVADQIPGAEVHIFSADEGGSHFMFIENPTKFNRLLKAFLAR